MREIQRQIMELYKKTIALLLKQILLLQKQIDFKQATNKNEIIYQTVKDCLGKNMRTRTGAKLGCADCGNNVFLEATGKEIGGDKSTFRMRKVLERDRRFKQTSEPEDICIIISATDFHKKWKNPEILHGHMGYYVRRDGVIYSNNSKTGLLDDEWTLEEWVLHYSGKGGFLVEFFRPM